jgi:hypothetical protein
MSCCRRTLTTCPSFPEARPSSTGNDRVLLVRPQSGQPRGFWGAVPFLVHLDADSCQEASCAVPVGSQPVPDLSSQPSPSLVH